jgi:hypothetical protein
MPPAALAELTIAADPERWRAVGFDVEDGVLQAGSIAIALAGRDAGRGILRWSLRDTANPGADFEGADFDGLPTSVVNGAAAAPAPRHDNAVVGLDHVVAFSPSLERTIARLRAAGLDFRRLREGATPAGAMRQAFFVVGDAVLEVIEHPPGTPQAKDRDAPAHFYGLALVVDDLDACAARMGDALGTPRDAIQPGRRIATARKEAGLGPPVAFMTPRPAREG